MKPTVYIETSVISYLTARPSRDLVVAAHQQLTIDWWDLAMPQLDGYISPIVLDEISKGDSKAAAKRLAVVDQFEVLELIPEIQILADLYFNAIDLPEKARADAYHLAIAVQHGMDYLVTWNCVHIAGARVKRILEVINDRRNFQTPIFCTPEELMEI
jgi:predicted nucleic acid-binding protein